MNNTQETTRASLEGHPTTPSSMEPIAPLSQELICYDDLTDAELLKMAKKRNIRLRIAIPTYLAQHLSSQMRQVYLTILRTNDEHSTTFRFLDLPAELRNRVYGYLLSLKQNGKCSPAILRSCRAVRTEATSILYGDNVFMINVNNGEVKLHQRERSKTVKGEYTFEWPRFLLKVRSIDFQIQWRDFPFGSHKASDRDHFITNVFSSLCTFLENKHRLRQMNVNFLHWRIPREAIEVDAELNLVHARLLARTNFTLTVHGACTPRPLIRDERSGLLRNAQSPAEARKIMIQLFQSLEIQIFERIVEVFVRIHKRAKDRSRVDELRTMHSMSVAGLNYESHSYDRALLKLGRMMWVTRSDHVFASAEQQWKLLNFAVELKAALREGQEAAEQLLSKRREARAAVQELKATEHQARIQAMELKAEERKVHLAAKEAKAAERKARLAAKEIRAAERNARQAAKVTKSAELKGSIADRHGESDSL